MFRKLLDSGQAGDNVGLLLRGTKREEVERGQVVVKPGSITPHTEFEAQVYILGKDEGGRHTPFFNNYRPQFFFRTTDVTGVVNLPEGTEMVMPGDTTDMNVQLIQPIAIEDGSALRHPRGWPHRRRRFGHQASSSELTPAPRFAAAGLTRRPPPGGCSTAAGLATDPPERGPRPRPPCRGGAFRVTAAPRRVAGRARAAPSARRRGAAPRGTTSTRGSSRRSCGGTYCATADLGRRGAQRSSSSASVRAPVRPRGPPV